MEDGTGKDRVERVREHLEVIWRASRRCREASAQLDGALTAGQSSRPDTRVGMSLKYEVGAGLLGDLEEALVALRPGGIATTPGLEPLAETLWNAHHLITTNLHTIRWATYADSAIVEQARFALRDVADAADTLLVAALAQASRPIGP